MVRGDDTYFSIRSPPRNRYALPPNPPNFFQIPKAVACETSSAGFYQAHWNSVSTVMPANDIIRLSQATLPSKTWEFLPPLPPSSYCKLYLQRTSLRTTFLLLEPSKAYVGTEREDVRRTTAKNWARYGNGKEGGSIYHQDSTNMILVNARLSLEECIGIVSGLDITQTKEIEGRNKVGDELESLGHYGTRYAACFDDRGIQARQIFGQDWNLSSWMRDYVGTSRRCSVQSFGVKGVRLIIRVTAGEKEEILHSGNLGVGRVLYSRLKVVGENAKIMRQTNRWMSVLAVAGFEVGTRKKDGFPAKLEGKIPQAARHCPLIHPRDQSYRSKETPP
ncbi:hypothetical protein EV360DRAFT_70082 [Lentinula raphanica]|nr:hypothetical protein EV360DRAFT_70082 [Lentinula raphanica]